MRECCPQCDTVADVHAILRRAHWTARRDSPPPAARTRSCARGRRSTREPASSCARPPWRG
ncbi:hypothetical protein B0H10DRAFT_2070011 [Mycena sp. CBHHK59/15]|nr:hypothetical protein B0H10DRAFT_2070011 [Mycena sp. CBHHK59/15]